MLNKSSKNFLEKYTHVFIFIFIICLSFILRFYKIQDHFVFSGDEEHQMSLAYSIVKDFHIEWVGVSSADTGFYLGPFWIYFGALWLKISKGDPQILPYIASSIGVITTIFIFILAKQIFNLTIAVFSSMLYATLPLIVYYDRKFWNPSLTAITSVLLLLTLILTKKSKFWWIILMTLYGFVYHVHLSLAPLGIIIFFMFLKNYKKIGFKIMFLSILCMTLVLSPLILFDYFTKGENISTPFRIFKQVIDRPARFDLVTHLDSFSSSLSRLWYIDGYSEISDQVLHSCNPEIGTNKNLIRGLTTTHAKPYIFLSIGSTVLLLIFLFSRNSWLDSNIRLLSGFILTILISYILLPNIALEYYLLGFFPLFLIAVSSILKSLNSNIKLLLIIFYITIAAMGVRTILIAKDNFGLTNKKFLIESVSKIINSEYYELETEGFCHKYEGWRFLSRAFGSLPVKSYSDDTFGWIYKEELSHYQPKYLILYKEIRDPSIIPLGYIKDIEKGGFKVYIYNSKRVSY